MIAATEIRKPFIEPADIETVDYPQEVIDEMLADIEDTKLKIARGEDRSIKRLAAELGINL